MIDVMKVSKIMYILTFLALCNEGPDVCAVLITFTSILMIILTLPLSLLWSIKVVQEYERAVIFRLGRLLTGGARGPGTKLVYGSLFGKFGKN